jgi:hypothetical protein
VESRATAEYNLSWPHGGGIMGRRSHRERGETEAHGLKGDRRWLRIIIRLHTDMTRQ